MRWRLPAHQPAGSAQPAAAAPATPPAAWAPPLCRLQPVKETQQKQRLLWKDLILRYCAHHRVYAVSAEEADDFPLFHNRAINRECAGGRGAGRHTRGLPLPVCSRKLTLGKERGGGGGGGRPEGDMRERLCRPAVRAPMPVGRLSWPCGSPAAGSRAPPCLTLRPRLECFPALPPSCRAASPRLPGAAAGRPGQAGERAVV